DPCTSRNETIRRFATGAMKPITLTRIAGNTNPIMNNGVALAFLFEIAPVGFTLNPRRTKYRALRPGESAVRQHREFGLPCGLIALQRLRRLQHRHRSEQDRRNKRFGSRCLSAN